jgi:PKD repeat protein
MTTPRSSTHQRLSDQPNYTLENQEVGGSFQTPVLEDDDGTFHAFSGVNQDDGSFTGRGGSNAEQSETKTDIFRNNARVNAIVAGFTANVTSGAAPLVVTFTNNTTGQPTNWFWDFGDGQYSRLENPTHTYSADGTYTVRLVASNSRAGDEHVATNYITVSSVSPLVVVFQDTFAVDGALNGLVPTQGGAAWVAPFVNLEPDVSAGNLTGVVGSGGDGTSLLTYTANPLSSLANANRFALRLSFPNGLSIPTGPDATIYVGASFQIIRDLFGPGEDTTAYLEIAAIGAGTTLFGLSNTIAAFLIIPGVGFTSFNLTGGSNYTGSQVFELIMNNSNGSWSLTRNGAEVTNGVGNTATFGSTDSATAAVLLVSGSTGSPTTVSEVAVLEG